MANVFENRIIQYGTKAADQFLANPLNYRTHPERQRKAVQASLRELGWIGVVVENRTTGRLIDGHERVWQALKNNEQVPYIEVELSEAEERLALAVFDPITYMAETDSAILDELLRDVNTGEEALQELLAGLAEDNGLYQDDKTNVDAEPQIDKAEELRVKWQVESGQLWQLGEHRLICGDCTDADVVARVMGGERAQIANTDPPYNVGRDYTEETDDTRVDYEEWSRKWFSLAQDNADNVAFSCGHPNVGMWAKIAPWKWIICWFKPGAMLGSPFGFSNWEPVLFYGKAQQKGTDVINAPIVVSNDPAMKAHPVPKQMDYAKKLLEMTSDDGGIVYDPFSGSGTTIIACEQLGRRARAIEISPAYCAVALERFCSAAGITPVQAG